MWNKMRSMAKDLPAFITSSDCYSIINFTMLIKFEYWWRPSHNPYSQRTSSHKEITALKQNSSTHFKFTVFKDFLSLLDYFMLNCEFVSLEIDHVSDSYVFLREKAVGQKELTSDENIQLVTFVFFSQMEFCYSYFCPPIDHPLPIFA